MGGEGECVGEMVVEKGEDEVDSKGEGLGEGRRQK